MRPRIPIKDWMEFMLAWLLLNTLGLLSLRSAQRLGEWAGLCVHKLWPKRRLIGLRNLELAFPALHPLQRAALLRQAFKNLGRQIGEFSQFPKLNGSNIQSLVEYEGLDYYLEAKRGGRGVIILTGHIGSWELSSYAHSLRGHPMRFLVRPLDNRLLEKLVDQYRGRGGNRSIPKKNSARSAAAALKRGETIGVLIDLNVQPQEGVFCDFFGIPACTSPLVAMLSARFRAPVLPGFLIWQPARRKHLLKFAAPIPLVRTQNPTSDLVRNTSLYNAIIAEQIRNYPDQWFWVHKRWHTRPPGESSLYS